MNWELYGTSKTAHLVADDSKKTKSGTKAVCGRYVGKSFKAFFTVSLSEPHAMELIRSYRINPCGDCLWIIKEEA